MSTLERAIEIAARAHAGQVDRGGHPYILHPLRLMLAVRTDHERMAAVLHDVVEDTSVTLEELTAAGFPAEVVEAVRILTKADGESRITAARRAAQNPVARAVKLADVADNMDLSRIAQPTERDFARLKEYEEVRALLVSYNAAAVDPDSPVSEREIILCVGGEGGDITLHGVRTRDGWRFQCNVVDQSLVMIDEGDEIRHDSQFTSSWDEALGLMDRYPWQHLYALHVHPEFGQAVWVAVQKRCAGECSEHAIERWREHCGVGD